MKKLIEKILAWTKQARVGVLAGAVLLAALGGVLFVRTWWNSSQGGNNSTTSSATTSSSITQNNTSQITSNKPVDIEVEEKFSRPYLEKVEVARSFYDVNSSVEEQSNAIVYYDGKYIPSNGIDYVSSNGSFDIIAACSGTVSDIITDPLYGLTVTVECANNIKVVYASLKNCQLQVGDSVSIKDKIGTSGESLYGSELNSEFLHFELYKDNKVVNPEKYYGILLKDIN